MQYLRQLKDNRSTVFVGLVDDKVQCLCISITTKKHKQRQAKQARETCFSMLITTVCLFNTYITLMLILIAGLRLRFIAILHIPIFYHWQQLQIGFIVLERQQEQAKNGTKWSFDADYYCLFIQHLHNAYACLLSLAYAIALQLFFIPLSYAYAFQLFFISLTLIFYHWHTLSLYPLPTIWHHISIKSSIPLFYYIPCTTMLVNALFQGL